MSHPDAYAGLNRLYLSQHPPEACDGRDIDDPVMSAWLATNLPSGARILDAGCGLGFDLLALHRGLPARGGVRGFEVYGADYSGDMLQDAQRLGVAAGIPADRYRRVSFAELGEVAAWRDAMDAVTVNYAIYTQPEGICDYGEYLVNSLRGLASAIKPGGVLVLNLRDWESLRIAQCAGVQHSHCNIHGGRTFHCRYNWYFGKGLTHRARLSMWEEDGVSRETDIWFAERNPMEIAHALSCEGLAVVGEGQHGSGADVFHTLIARRNGK